MLSSTARQALKRATLYRLHSPLTVSPKVRRASSSTSPSAGSSRYKALRYAAGGFAAAGGASGAEWGRGGPDGSSSGTKDGPTQQLGALREEKDSGEDEDGDDTGKEDEEKQKTTVAKGKGKAGSSDAEAREEDGFVQEGEGPQGHKKREKGKGKELPRPKKRLRTDDGNYYSSSATTITSSPSSAGIAVPDPLQGLGPILAPGPPPTPHIAETHYESPALLPRTAGTDEGLPSTSSPSSDQLAMRFARPVPGSGHRAPPPHDDSSAPSDTSDNPLRLRPSLPALHRRAARAPLDRAFEEELGWQGVTAPQAAQQQREEGSDYVADDEHEEMTAEEIEAEWEAARVAYERSTRRLQSLRQRQRAETEAQEAARRRANRGEGGSGSRR